MDYTLILQSLQDSLTQKEAAYSAAVDRSAALGAEHEKAQAKETQLAADVEQTKAAIRGIEALIQQGDSHA